ncbi:DNA polymerase III subunit epsilon [Vreelandella aquamarina]|uniref:DNA polymerase III subunit epsilon n=1 Tax=Vreelandella aquamarina TaxID=77097 RepID=UPI00384DB252
MRLLDRHMTLFSGSLRTLLQRESDRRRWANSPYAWLFQPYMGEEAVALACQVSDARPAVVSLAAIVLSPQKVHTSRTWVATLAAAPSLAPATLRRHHQLHDTQLSRMPDAECLGELAEFIGNRPLVGWQLDQTTEPLNGLFRAALGFGLPNAQVDIAKLNARQLRRLHPQVDVSSRLSDALTRWHLPSLSWPSVVSEATASALLYLRLQREIALTD